MDCCRSWLPSLDGVVLLHTYRHVSQGNNVRVTQWSLRSLVTCEKIEQLRVRGSRRAIFEQNSCIVTQAGKHLFKNQLNFLHFQYNRTIGPHGMRQGGPIPLGSFNQPLTSSAWCGASCDAWRCSWGQHQACSRKGCEQVGIMTMKKYSMKRQLHATLDVITRNKSK